MASQQLNHKSYFRSGFATLPGLHNHCNRVISLAECPVSLAVDFFFFWELQLTLIILVFALTTQEFQQCTLLVFPLFPFSLGDLFLFLSFSPPFFPHYQAQSFGKVQYSTFSLVWTPPPSSGCTLSHIYNKVLPLNQTQEQSSCQFIQVGIWMCSKKEINERFLFLF